MVSRPLIDPFHRQITYLRVSITDRCNLHCTYCTPVEGIDWVDREEILRYEEIIQIVTVAARRGLRKVRVTGGEPLVRRGVVDFIRMLGGVPGLEDIALTTNGVLLKELAGPLKKAGVHRINVSLDSLQPEKFARIVRGGKEQFRRVWEGIEEADRIGYAPLKINCVLQMGVNDDEVVDFARLTLKRPWHIRFIEYMPCSSWEDWRSKYMPVDEIRERIGRELGPLLPLNGRNEEGAGPADNCQIEGALGVVGFITAVSHDFCGTCNRIRLTADGKIRPCLFNEIAVDLKEALRRGCSDEEIDALLDTVMSVKPEYHELDLRPQDKMLKAMVNIGG